MTCCCNLVHLFTHLLKLSGLPATWGLLSSTQGFLLCPIKKCKQIHWVAILSIGVYRTGDRGGFNGVSLLSKHLWGFVNFLLFEHAEIVDKSQKTEEGGRREAKRKPFSPLPSPLLHFFCSHHSKSEKTHKTTTEMLATQATME